MFDSYCNDCKRELIQINDIYWWCQHCGSLYNSSIELSSRVTKPSSLMFLEDMFEEYQFTDKPDFEGHLEIFFKKRKKINDN